MRASQRGLGRARAIVLATREGESAQLYRVKLEMYTHTHLTSKISPDTAVSQFN